MLTKLHMLQDVHGHWNPAMRNASRWAQIAYHSRSNDGECRCVLVRLSKVWYDRWVFELIDHKELTAYVPVEAGSSTANQHCTSVFG